MLYSRAEMLALRNMDSLAMITLDSISMLGLSHPLDDDVLYSKAKIYIKSGNYLLADSLLDKVVTQYADDILADNALMKRAWLYEEVFEDKEMAMELYQQMLTQYPGSLFTVEARKRFRTLRGDKLES
jgi:outer membrane protein assembly factor BamD (BamD/ComL family)